jgi:uncharacterized protein YdiU (UPF0061 family)
VMVTGESFDYGPYRFLEVYDPKFVAAYFDPVGLYAFGRQPNALFWNLCRLAECLMPFTSPARLEAIVTGFDGLFAEALADATLRRLALAPTGPVDDIAFAGTFYGFMAESRIGFERIFYDWRGGSASEARAENSPAAALYREPAFAEVRAGLTGRTPIPDAKLDHPYFAAGRPCTLLIGEIEALWEPIAAADDWSAWSAKLAEIATCAEAYGTAIPARSRPAPSR